MADAAAPSLGDFFKSKGKKKVKASNLNKAEEQKTEDKKKAASKEDDAWQEDEVVASTIQVAVVGKLMREENQVQEEVAAPAWGVSKKEAVSGVDSKNEKRYPTLAKAVGSSSINIDDGSDAKVNITTSKNRFADLEGEDDEEDGGGNKRPKSIKPAMVSKKQGEWEKVALKREVDKYKSKPIKKKTKEASAENDDEEDEEEEDASEAEDGDEEALATAEEARKKMAQEKRKQEKKAKKLVQEEDEEAQEEEQLEDDLKIQVDLVESKDKYKGRKTLPPKDLPRSELEKQKENTPKQQNASGKKKKFVEEETEKKLAYADW